MGRNDTGVLTCRRFNVTYNITGWRSTGTEFHGAFEEHVVAIVELEDVEVHVVTIDQWNAGFYIVKVATEYITVLTATGSQRKYFTKNRKK